MVKQQTPLQIINDRIRELEENILNRTELIFGDLRQIKSRLEYNKYLKKFIEGNDEDSDRKEKMH